MSLSVSANYASIEQSCLQVFGVLFDSARQGLNQTPENRFTNFCLWHPMLSLSTNNDDKSIIFSWWFGEKGSYQCTPKNLCVGERQYGMFDSVCEAMTTGNQKANRCFFFWTLSNAYIPMKNTICFEIYQYLRYLRKTNITVFSILPAIKWTKFQLYCFIFLWVIFFGYVVYFSADTH